MESLAAIYAKGLCFIVLALVSAAEDRCTKARLSLLPNSLLGCCPHNQAKI